MTNLILAISLGVYGIVLDDIVNETGFILIQILNSIVNVCLAYPTLVFESCKGNGSHKF